MEYRQIFDLSDIEFKPGVHIGTIQPVMQVAAKVIAEVYESYNKKLVITATTDGKHMNGSRHYLGLAIDCRTNFFTANELHSVAAKIKERLGCMFDVVVEKTHFHVEWKYLI